MAKQFDFLFDEITSFEHLWQAFKPAAQGNRNQVEVADFETNADFRVLEIQRALQRGPWLPGPYRSQFSTPKPGTRRNSVSLSVTSVAPSAKACAAMKVSLGPIGAPDFSSCVRILA